MGGTLSAMLSRLAIGMKLIKVSFFIFLLALSCVHSQTRRSKIPEGIKSILDNDYPGWTRPKLNELWEIARWKKEQASPNEIWGDFNGDGLRDCVLQIVFSVPSDTEKKRIILAFLQRDHIFNKMVLETSPIDKSRDITLDLIKKGSQRRYFDWHTREDKTFIFQADAIKVEYSADESITYYWRDGKFTTRE